MKMRIKKGDRIKVLCGKDRGKESKVIKAFPSVSKVLVEGINLVKKHQKARKAGEKSERITVAMPINVSNVQLVCPKCSKPTRVGKKIMDNDGNVVRICKKCQAEI